MTGLIPGVDYMTAAQMAALDPWYGPIIGWIIFWSPVWVTVWVLISAAVKAERGNP